MKIIIVGGTIEHRDVLFLQTPKEFRSRFRIDVRVRSEVVAMVHPYLRSQKIDLLLISSAKDPVNMAGYIAGNILEGQLKVVHWQDIQNISPDAMIIDVRTQEEFETGHIDKAVNIPLDRLSGEIGKLNKTVPVVAVCESGARSAYAVQLLKREGFEAYNGGGWQSFQGR